jgi:predicted hydrocarbon binding protein
MNRGERVVRGQTLVNASAFCSERFGEEGWQRVREALPPQSADVFENADRGSWYDLDIYTEVLDTITHVLGDGDLRIMEKLGYYAAEQDLTKTMQLFVRVATPAFLMRGYAQLWGRYHSTGTWRVEKEGPCRLRARLSGWDSSEAACVSVGSFIERFVQLVGGHNARVMRTKCASRGDSQCEYICEWESAP